MSTLIPIDGAPLLETWRALPADELLDALDAGAQQDVRDKRPPNTTAAYAEDWAVWERFCGVLGVPPLTTRSGLFYAFVRHLEDQGLAPSTIERRLAGVVTSLRDRDVVLPPRGGPAHAARLEIADYERRLIKDKIPYGRGKAPVLERGDACRMCERTPDDLWGLRAKAIVLLGLRVAARRSEVSALDVSDIVLTRRGLEVTVRVSKGGKTRTVPVAFDTDERVCAVRAWLAWLHESGATEAAFCHIRERGCLPPLAVPTKRLGPKAVNNVVAKMGAKVGIDAATCHSLRATFTTNALEDGVPEHLVRAITGHASGSRALYEYFRQRDLWGNSALRVAL